jgi:hypothetical protein
MYRMEDEYINEEYFTSDCDNEDETDKLFVMYKIVPKNKEVNYCYIGHTTNFVQRRRAHMKNTINEGDKKHYHLKHYQVIRENGGWDEWEMIELEKCKFKTKLEARMREQQLIEEYSANLNSLKAYISGDHRKELKKQITQKYREENKELLKEQTKKYKQDHKEIIAEQMKKYRAENKEKIYAKTKEYKENNKDKHQEWQRIWREKNKDLLREKRKLYEAKKKEEKLAQKALVDPEEERLKKEQQKKEKREQYNAQRRLKRLQEKEEREKEKSVMENS